MTASVPWSVNAVDPEAWATARNAARRSGLSVGEWLEAAIRDVAAARSGRTQKTLGDDSDLPDPVLQRSIEGLHERIESMMNDMRAAHSDGPAEVQSAIQRLEERIEMVLSRGSGPRTEASADLERKLSDMAGSIENLSRKLERDVAQTSTPPSVADLDAAIAEVMLRQSTLERAPAPAEPESASGFMDLTKLEAKLKIMADEMQAMRRASGRNDAGDAVQALRHEMSALSGKVGELAPRSSLEALEKSISTLADKIDKPLAGGQGDRGMSDVAHALQEIHTSLADIRPAESFSAVERDLRALSQKLDSLGSGGADSGMLARLQEQTAEIRNLLSGALPNEILKALVDQVETLVRKFDEGMPAPERGVEEAIARFERRIDALAERVEQTARHAPQAPALDDIRARLDELQHALDRSEPAHVPHLEAALTSLSEKVEAAEARLAHLGGIERGLNDLFAQLEEARSSAHQVAERVARSALREMNSPPSIVPELPPQLREEAEFRPVREDAPDVMPPARRRPAPPAPIVPRVEPEAAAPATDDFPLEPGSGAPRMRQQSAYLRVAQSEAALGASQPEATAGSSRTSDFIAAARRAAQEAAQETPPAAAPKPAASQGTRKANAGWKRGLLIMLAACLVVFAAIRFFPGYLPSFLPFVTSSAKRAPAAETPKVEPAAKEDRSSRIDTPAVPPRPEAHAEQPADAEFVSAPPAGVIGDAEVSHFFAKSLMNAETGSAPAPVAPAQAAAPAAAPVPAAKPAEPVVTGSTPARQQTPEAQSNGLPAALGTQAFRNAAVSGDPIAAYEVALRYLEGRGVPANPGEGLVWLERAIEKGSAPAAYRLGSIYEKGRGLTKNLVEARRYYQIAADAGNVKAMHNLAVLYAEGGAGEPDYAKAAVWFRKAADHGVSDSQFNLGVLYARGLGVEADLTQSYQWFGIAAEQGDKEAAKKRDEVAKRLDVRSLMAAKFAVQTWSVTAIDPDANDPALRPEWQQAGAAAAQPQSSKK